MILTIILLTIIIICLILIIESNKYNRFEELIIRINEAEANIDALLNKRFDLLNKSINIIKGETKIDKEILGDIVKIRSRKLNNFDLDEQLNKAYKEFNYYVDNYASLKDNDSFMKIEIDLLESTSTIIALKKYYNDVTKKYNDLTKTFPSSIVAKFKKYKIKPLFIEEEIEEKDELKDIILEDTQEHIQLKEQIQKQA